MPAILIAQRWPAQEIVLVKSRPVPKKVVKVTRNAEVRLLRDNVVIHTGRISTLRRFKEDAPEVKAGTECGIGVKNYNDVKAGDQIEVFERTERAREL